MQKVFEINKRLNLGLAPIIYTSDFKEQDYKALDSLLIKDGYKPFHIDFSPLEMEFFETVSDKEALFITLQSFENKLSFCRKTFEKSNTQICIFDFKFFYNNPFLNRLKKDEYEVPFVLWYLSYPIPQNILFHLLKSDTNKQIGAISCAGEDIEKIYNEAKQKLYKLDRFKDEKEFKEWQKSCSTKIP